MAFLAGKGLTFSCRFLKQRRHRPGYHGNQTLSFANGMLKVLEALSYPFASAGLFQHSPEVMLEMRHSVLQGRREMLPPIASPSSLPPPPHHLPLSAGGAECSAANQFAWHQVPSPHLNNKTIYLLLSRALPRYGILKLLFERDDSMCRSISVLCILLHSTPVSWIV